MRCGSQVRHRPDQDVAGRAVGGDEVLAGRIEGGRVDGAVHRRDGDVGHHVAGQIPDREARPLRAGADHELSHLRRPPRRWLGSRIRATGPPPPAWFAPRPLPLSVAAATRPPAGSTPTTFTAPSVVNRLERATHRSGQQGVPGDHGERSAAGDDGAHARVSPGPPPGGGTSAPRPQHDRSWPLRVPSRRPSGPGTTAAALTSCASGAQVPTRGAGWVRVAASAERTAGTRRRACTRSWPGAGRGRDGR